MPIDTQKFSKDIMKTSKKPDAVKPQPKIVQRRKVIFRRYRLDPRTGIIMDAHAYGYKAWPIVTKA